MSKITLNSVVNLRDATTAATTINSNTTTLQTAFDNTLSRDGTSPNQMASSLDMNGNRILNLPAPISPTEPARLQDVTGSGSFVSIPPGGTTGQVLTKTDNLNFDVAWTTPTVTTLTAGTNLNIASNTISTVSNPSFTTSVSTPLIILAGSNITGLTGTGNTVALSVSPIFTTPVLGAATATSVNKVAITAPLTGSTLTIADGKTLTASNTITLAGTDGTTQTFPASSGTVLNSTSAAAGDLAGTYPNPTVATSTITNAKMANMAANTIKGNLTSGAAAPTDFTIDGLTLKATPVGGDELIIWDSVGLGIKKALISSVGSSAGVSSINTQTGALTTGFGLKNVGTVFSAATVNPFLGTGLPINLQLNTSVATNILTVTVVGNNGATPSATNPVLIPFRDANIANGDPVWIAVTSALSMTTFAAGATLGSTNTVPFRLWVVAFNNAGTVVLGLINCSVATTTSAQVFPLPVANLVSSTPISGTATSAGVFYTPNGTTVTNVPFAVLGYLDFASGLTTAGQYASVPTTIQLFGPHTKLPGSIIQSAMNSTTTGTTNLTATFASTNITQSITPTSSVNLIRAGYFTLGSNSNPGADNLLVALFRGSTQIGMLLGLAGSGASTIWGSFGGTWFDNPGSTASQTYVVKIRNATGTATAAVGPLVGGTTFANIVLDEVMS